tara:strand:+ start:578 stop:1012 length:435 start_codon:yes stop_codon:yes gene_type:complete
MINSGREWDWMDNKTKMKDKTIILEGVEYNLVPVEETEVNENSVTFYYGCVSDCGLFEFSILLNDDDEIWEGTQSVTYYPEGYKDKNKCEIWDNTSFLADVLEYHKTPLPDINIEVTNLRTEIGNHKFIDLTNLLQLVRKKGWV